MSNKKPFYFKELSYQIIGAAFKVHSTIGCGLPEHVYGHALCHEFTALHIAHDSQKDFDVRYNDNYCGNFRPDIIVDDKIILELKSVEHLIPPHEAQLFCYLKVTGLKVGYLLNFGSKSLQFKRLIL